MARPSLVQRLLAVLVAVMGLVNISSALFVHDGFRNQIIQTVLPLALMHVSRSLALLAGFALVLIAYGLWRGKHIAWLLTLVLLGSSAAFHLSKGLDWEEAAVALLLAGALWSQRGAFRGRSDPPTLRRIPLFIATGTALIVGYGLVGFALLHAFRPFSWNDGLQELVAQIFWSDGPLAALVQGRATWFLTSLGLLTQALIVGTLLLLLRPVLPRPGASDDRRRAEDLVRRYGSSSLAPFALDDDKLLYFGETIEGVVAYRVAGGVAVVCGDPIAAPDQVGTLAVEFTAFCQRQDWQVCFYEVQPDYVPDYAQLGFQQVKIGEDAWIDLPQFTLKGSAISDIRHAVNKIVRDGVIFRVFDPATDEALWQQMQAIEADWRATQGGVELRFSIGRLAAQPAPGAHYTLALATDGATVLAFCSFLPIGGINGLALDVMRRASQVPNGTMEFLIARSLEHFRDAGYSQLSLGLAPLANVDAPGNSLLERGMQAIYRSPKVNEIYRYRSLFFFKQKFNPQWRGGYLLYPGALALPNVLTAVIRVHAPALGLRLGLEALREQVKTTLSMERKPSEQPST